MGPSLPTEPPVPIVMAEAKALMAATRGRITPPRMRMACITSGTPWPFASGAKKWMRGPTISPPIAGIRITHHQSTACTAERKFSELPKDNSFTVEINQRIKIAPKPAIRPITTERPTMKIWSEPLARSMTCQAKSDAAFTTLLLLSFNIFGWSDYLKGYKIRERKAEGKGYGSSNQKLIKVRDFWSIA